MEPELLLLMMWGQHLLHRCTGRNNKHIFAPRSHYQKLSGAIWVTSFIRLHLTSGTNDFILLRLLPATTCQAAKRSLHSCKCVKNKDGSKSTATSRCSVSGLNKNTSGRRPNISDNSRFRHGDEMIYCTAHWREKKSWTPAGRKEGRISSSVVLKITAGSKSECTSMWCHQNNKTKQKMNKYWISGQVAALGDSQCRLSYFCPTNKIYIQYESNFSLFFQMMCMIALLCIWDSTLVWTQGGKHFSRSSFLMKYTHYIYGESQSDL